MRDFSVIGWTVWWLMLTAACRTNDERTGTRSGQLEPRHVDAVTPCEIEKRLLDQMIDCIPDEAARAKSLRATLDDILSGQGSAGAPRSARERTGALCAFGAYADDQQFSTRSDLRCRVALDRHERESVRDYLIEYYRRRTTPRRTDNAAIDRKLGELAASRDAVCACATADCVRVAETAVYEVLTPIPPEVTGAVVDAEAILDEVSRCRARIVDGMYPFAL